jgi:O-antigen/teichoic acid export membrane protein
MKKSVTYILSIATALIPIYFISVLIRTLDSTEFILFNTLNIITGIVVALDFGVAQKLLVVASRKKHNGTINTHILLKFLRIWGLILVFTVIIGAGSIKGYFVPVKSNSIELIYGLFLATSCLRLMNKSFRQIMIINGQLLKLNIINFTFVVARYTPIIFYDSKLDILLHTFFWGTLAEMIILYCITNKHITNNREMLTLAQIKCIIVSGWPIYLCTIVSAITQYVDRIFITKIVEQNDATIFFGGVSVAQSVLLVLAPLTQFYIYYIFKVDNKTSATENLKVPLTALSVIASVGYAVYLITDELISEIILGYVSLKFQTVLINYLFGNVTFYILGLLYFNLLKNEKLYLIILLHGIGILSQFIIFEFFNMTVTTLPFIWPLVNSIKVIVIISYTQELRAIWTTLIWIILGLILVKVY